MILYHGTNTDFESIDIQKSNKYKDFGQGFYLTDIFSQAKELAEKKTKLFGGYSIVQEYEFDESLLADDELNVLIFETPSKEWAEFVYNNRSRYKNYKHNYDIVVGAIADDGVAYLLSRYEEGTFTLEELAKELQYKKLNRQYFFGTIKAVNLLKRLK